MYVELFVLSVLLLTFALWIRHGSSVAVITRKAPKLVSPTRPIKNVRHRPKHHESPEYIRKTSEIRRKTAARKLEEWQQRARSECLP